MLAKMKVTNSVEKCQPSAPVSRKENLNATTVDLYHASPPDDIANIV